MKKISVFLFVALLLTLASPAFALMPQRAARAGNGAQTWELVEIASNETTLVSAGTVLVYDVNNGIDSTEAGWRVKVATASADAAFVAGVAQQEIATRDSALVLVRGPGVIRVNSEAVASIASGDDLWVSNSGDVAEVTSTTLDQVAFARENGASGDSTIDAYITIL